MNLKRFNNIGTMLMVPFVVLTIMICIAYGLNYGMMASSLSDLQLEQIESNYNTTSSTFRHDRANLDVSIQVINDQYSTFYDAVAEADTAIMIEEMTWTRNSSGSDGYIFTTMEGDVVVTSYEGQINESKLLPVVETTIEKGQASGYSDFLEGKIVDFSSIVAINDDEEEIGVVFLISYDLNDKKMLGDLKDQMGIDLFVFKGKECVNSTNDEIEIATIQLDTAIISTSYLEKKPWINSSKMFNRKDYLASLPLISIDGNVLGLMLMRANTEITDEILSGQRLVLPVTIVIMVVFIVLIIILIRKRIVNPMRDLTDDLMQISTGDLTYKVKAEHTCAEIAQLAESITETERKIREVLNPVMSTADAVVTSAGQLARASEVLSNAANRQAAALEEISSSMEQMGANIQNNTDNSVHTNTLAKDINNMMAILSKSSTNSFESIKNITANINDINDLVSQTNILALNASVEAARAGEHGLGFGVVAKEVGRLAEQTHSTANDINEFATTSIAEVEQVFNNVTQITPMIEKLVNLVKEITTASVEQNTGASQINTAIMDLNRVTQENAASAEEISASTQQMQDMIENLNRAINIFKI